MSEKPRIRDIPSIQKAVKNANLIAMLARWTPRLRPFLKPLGIDLSEAERVFADAGDVLRIAEDIASVPDRFNDLFVARGWIMYDLINLEAAKQAIAAADSGAFDEADKILADTYTVDWIRFQLLRLGSSEAFEPRLRLAELALADYEAARYHASIPVVLALLDGFVHDVRGKDFFSTRDSDLTAFDSIAAHEAGLKALHAVLNKGRHKRCADSITVPYRHGIVHGSDLAYDNRIVAAKTWAALFAVAEWGIRVERGQGNAPEPTAQKTLRGAIRDYIGQQREFARIKRKFEEWRPRSLLIGRDLPAWAPEESYEKASPERAVVALLTLWKRRNYRGIVDFVTFRNEEPPNRLAAELRRMLDDIRLTSCALISVEDVAMLAAKIVVRCEGQLVDARAFACDVEFKLMFESDKGDSLLVRGDPGVWTVPLLNDSAWQIRRSLLENDERGGDEGPNS